MSVIERSYSIYVALLEAKGEYSRSSQYGCSIASVEKTLGLMDTEPCPVLLDYLRLFVPEVVVGPGFADFLTVERINAEHKDYTPSCGAVKRGFFTFASAGDGSAYALCNHNQKIYLLPVGSVQTDNVQIFSNDPFIVALTLDNIIKASRIQWPDLYAFFLWLENEVHQ